LEERLNKIRSHAIASRILSKDIANLVPIFALLAMPAIIIYASNRLESSNTKLIIDAHNNSKSLEDYIHKVNLIQAGQIGNINAPMVALLLPIAALVFATVIRKPIARWYPIYTFYWGDAVKFYKIKMNAIRFLIIGVFLTVILGMATNYLYDKLF